MHKHHITRIAHNLSCNPRKLIARTPPVPGIRDRSVRVSVDEAERLALDGCKDLLDTPSIEVFV
jgi:hypothetical protein